MNPYASHLGERDALEVMAATPARLEQAMERLGPERVERPLAPGKWSPRQVLCHLADTELAFAFRLRQALAEDHHVIQPFDQDKWSAAYPVPEAASALDVFGAVRAWNVNLLRSVPPAAFDKPVTHPERGTMTFRVLVETIAGHDLNHVGQIEAAG